MNFFQFLNSYRGYFIYVVKHYITFSFARSTFLYCFNLLQYTLIYWNLNNILCRKYSIVLYHTIKVLLLMNAWPILQRSLTFSYVKGRYQRRRKHYFRKHRNRKSTCTIIDSKTKTFIEQMKIFFVTSILFSFNETKNLLFKYNNICFSYNYILTLVIRLENLTLPTISASKFYRVS